MTDVRGVRDSPRPESTSEYVRRHRVAMLGREKDREHLPLLLVREAELAREQGHERGIDAGFDLGF